MLGQDFLIAREKGGHRHRFPEFGDVPMAEPPGNENVFCAGADLQLLAAVPFLEEKIGQGKNVLTPVAEAGQADDRGRKLLRQAGKQAVFTGQLLSILPACGNYPDIRIEDRTIPKTFQVPGKVFLNG